LNSVAAARRGGRIASPAGFAKYITVGARHRSASRTNEHCSGASAAGAVASALEKKSSHGGRSGIIRSLTARCFAPDIIPRVVRHECSTASARRLSAREKTSGGDATMAWSSGRSEGTT
jgi:hypothetical protein